MWSCRWGGREAGGAAVAGVSGGRGPVDLPRPDLTPSRAAPGQERSAGGNPRLAGTRSQGLPVNLPGTVEGAGGTQRAEDACIEQVELVTRHGGSLCALAENRQTKRDQQVFEDAYVLHNRLASHFALSGDRRDVQLAAVGEAHRLQEPREGSDVAHKALRPYLLIDVEAGVGIEGALGGGPVDHHRNQADPEGSLKVEVGQLGPPMKGWRVRPPRRLTSPRRSLRALDPVSTKRGGDGSSSTASTRG